MECQRCRKSLAYEKVVKEVNQKMAEVEKTPEALAQVAMQLFGVDIAVDYLRGAKTHGLMKMWVCNRIAAALKKVG